MTPNIINNFRSALIKLFRNNNIKKPKYVNALIKNKQMLSAKLIYLYWYQVDDEERNSWGVLDVDSLQTVIKEAVLRSSKPFFY